MLTIFSCKEEPTESMGDSTPVISTYYLIRHAEKDRSNPDNPDPELNQKGLGRAMHWAEILDDVSLDAIYSTDYERTRMTAAPVSIKQDISVTYYDPANLDINAFKSETLGKKVLVVSKSAAGKATNTTPALVNRLIGEERYPQMEDDDNGGLFIVTIFGTNSSVSRLQFNCNCPE